MPQKIRKAVFTVGGMGTRFLPATKAIPKEMMPVVDKPLIQYAVEEAQAAGIEEFVFVTGRGKYAIEDHFDQAYELEKSLAERGKTEALQLLEGIRLPAGRVAYTRQQEPLGLGHAVWCARQLVGNEPFALLLADDLIMADTPCLAQMVKTYEQQAAQGRPAHIVATMQVDKDKVNRYGVLDVESEDGQLVKARGLVEKPAPEEAPSTHAIVGRYILQPEVFEPLEAKQRGAGGEIQLTDAIAATMDKVDFYGYQFEGHRFDCGSKIGFFEAQLAYTLKRPDMADRARAVLGKYS